MDTRTDLSPQLRKARSHGWATRHLRAICGADGAWDALLGVGLCLAPWPVFADTVGLPPARPWPVFVGVGVGSLAFAALLTRAAQGQETINTARAAAIGNAAGVAAVVTGLILLQPLPLTGTLVLSVAAAGCASFAGLQWRGSEAGASAYHWLPRDPFGHGGCVDQRG